MLSPTELSDASGTHVDAAAGYRTTIPDRTPTVGTPTPTPTPRDDRTPLLRRITITQKLWGMAGVAVIVSAVMSIVGITSLNNVSAAATHISTSDAITSQVDLAYRDWLLDDDQSNMYVAVLALNDPSQHDLAESTWTQTVDAYQQSLAALHRARAITADAGVKADIDKLVDLMKQYNGFSQQVRADALANKVSAAIHVMTVENLEPSTKLPKLFDLVTNGQNHDVAVAKAEARSATSTGRWSLIGAALIGLVLMVGAAWFIIRSISRPLGRIVTVLEAIARGDRSLRVEHRNDDEIGKLATSLTQVVGFLDAADVAAARAEVERAEQAERERLAALEKAEAERRAVEREAELERERLETERAEAERVRLAEAERAEAERQRLEEDRARERAAAEAEAARAAEEAKEAAEVAARVAVILEYVTAVAGGDLTRELAVEGSDNVGQMAEALRQLTGSLRASMADIGQTASSVAAASEQLTALGQNLDRGARSASDLAASVSAASEQVSSNIAAVASATEEMTASIREIASNATSASTVAAQAVSAGEAAKSTVGHLGTSSAEIGDVVKLITSIATQTNLLALNATIEAARAGDAGKGFAVVANEVKELAAATSKATEEIGVRIETIQSDTQGAVSAIAEITDVVGRINEIQATIASAVEEQAATTREISRAVTEAAVGANGIAADISQVAVASGETLTGAQSAVEAAASLNTNVESLDRLVGEFRY